MRYQREEWYCRTSGVEWYGSTSQRLRRGQGLLCDAMHDQLHPHRPGVVRPESRVMPTYQYRCTDCSQDLEAFQKFTDAPLQDCPSCNGQLRKVFSSVGVVFKGSGFYSTDNNSRTAGRPPRNEAPAVPSGSGPSSSETSRVSMTSGSTSGSSASSAPKAASSTGTSAAS